MTDQELIAALRRDMVEIGSLICLGCGHEHSCSAHGCAIIREAADALERLGAENAALCARKEPKPPLTVEPCWCRDCEHCYTDIDAEGGTKYLRCGNSVSWFIREIVRDKNTCGECKRRNPEEGTRHDD